MQELTPAASRQTTALKTSAIVVVTDQHEKGLQCATAEFLLSTDTSLTTIYF